MLTETLLKPIQNWIFSLHEETRLLRTETTGLRNDIAAMRTDVHDEMGLLTKLMGELKKVQDQMQEQSAFDHEIEYEEDESPKWAM